MARSQLPPFPDNVPVANIATVDYDNLVQGDKAASQTLYEAATGYGFFYLKNHHVDSQFMFDLADETLNLPFDELIKYEVKFSDGGYFGYKVAGDQIVDEKGTADCSQFYNISSMTTSQTV